MTINDIVNYANEIAPFELADSWDNIGLLAGSGDTEVRRVMTALDITAAVVEEAREKGCGLIVSHHPVIFEPLRALRPGTAPYLLAKYDIAALCLHTDLDRAEQGVNTALADALGLKNTVSYPDDYLTVGDYEKAFSADEYAAFVRDRLNAPSVRYTDGCVRRVAVSSGGGGGGVELSEQYGFDAFVTGELKHHQYLYAVENGIAAFDAGHFSTEDVVIEPLRKLFADKFTEIEFIKSESSVCPYKAI